ncbi:MAG TPA: hypothetical protein VFU61_02745, partial [Steroidobacteraceae bacterium]|nr:hypothetical protein [Steroidobacteraceae bacterium]
MQLHFPHLESDAARQHGQEAVLIAVEIDLLQHAALHGPHPAAEVVEALAGDPREEAMEELPAISLEPGAGAWPALPDCKVG